MGVSSFLPAVKCSSCGDEINISMMGDHLCRPLGSNERRGSAKNASSNPRSRSPSKRSWGKQQQTYSHRGQVSTASTSGSSDFSGPTTPRDDEPIYASRGPAYDEYLDTIRQTSQSMESKFPHFPKREAHTSTAHFRPSVADTLNFSRIPSPDPESYDDSYEDRGERNAPVRAKPVKSSVLQRMNTLASGPFGSRKAAKPNDILPSRPEVLRSIDEVHSPPPRPRRPDETDYSIRSDSRSPDYPYDRDTIDNEEYSCGSKPYDTVTGHSRLKENQDPSFCPREQREERPRDARTKGAQGRLGPPFHTHRESSHEGEKRDALDDLLSEMSSNIDGQERPSSCSTSTSGSLKKAPRSSKSAPCRACRGNIHGKALTSRDGSLSGRWHRECFGCHSCSKVFAPEETFYVLDDRPFCARHYHKQNGSLCKRCGHGIEGRAVCTPDEDRFHPYCFTCVDCYKPLGKEYIEIEGRSYCAHDAKRMLTQNRHTKYQRRQTRLMSFGAQGYDVNHTNHRI